MFCTIPAEGKNIGQAADTRQALDSRGYCSYTDNI